jgi:hypothetical protein
VRCLDAGVADVRFSPDPGRLIDRHAAAAADASDGAGPAEMRVSLLTQTHLALLLDFFVRLFLYR